MGSRIWKEGKVKRRRGSDWKEVKQGRLGGGEAVERRRKRK